MKQILLPLAATSLLAAVPGPVSEARNSPLVYEAGRCIVQHNRAEANMLMRTLPLDDSIADLSRLTAQAAACAAPLAGAPAMQVRGALAQAMFMRDFGSIGREVDSQRAFIDLALPTQMSPTGSRTIELYRWGDCVARNDATGAERMLRTEAGSPEETAAIEALRKYMAACLPYGTPLDLRQWELRSVIAQSTYHVAYRVRTGQLQPVRSAD